MLYNFNVQLILILRSISTLKLSRKEGCRMFADAKWIFLKSFFHITEKVKIILIRQTDRKFNSWIRPVHMVPERLKTPTSVIF